MIMQKYFAQVIMAMNIKSRLKKCYQPNAKLQIVRKTEIRI